MSRYGMQAGKFIYLAHFIHYGDSKCFTKKGIKIITKQKQGKLKRL